MKLTLSQQELEQAVSNYVNGMINLQPGTDMATEFRAGRGDNGTTAQVDISYLSVASIPAMQAKVSTLTFPAGARGAETIKADIKPAVEILTRAAPDKAVAKEAEPEPEVRKTSGKSLFGSTTKVNPAHVDTETLPANDDTDESLPEEKAAAASGGRKTLFSD